MAQSWNDQFDVSSELPYFKHFLTKWFDLLLTDWTRKQNTTWSQMTSPNIYKEDYLPNRNLMYFDFPFSSLTYSTNKGGLVLLGSCQWAYCLLVEMKWGYSVCSLCLLLFGFNFRFFSLCFFRLLVFSLSFRFVFLVSNFGLVFALSLRFGFGFLI